MAAAPIPHLSASVTRILALTGFPPELKTKDIQAAFGEFDAMNGGFRIKWVDDTSLLLVFNDAGVGESNLFSSHLLRPTEVASLTNTKLPNSQARVSPNYPEPSH